MRKIKTFIPFLIMGILLISSCETYEEGPGFTLTSKNARLEKVWYLKSINNAIVNGDILWTFEKGGSYLTSYNGNQSNNPAIWSFGDDKTLEIYYVNDNRTDVYNILQLSADFLTLSITQGSATLRYDLEAN